MIEARCTKALALFAVLFAVVVVHATPAAAAHVATCKVFEIKASNGEGGLDKELKPLKKKFKKPPFSAWKSFKLLAKHVKTIGLKESVSLKLKTGGKLTLMFRGRNAEKNKKVRLRIKFALDDKKGKRSADGTLSLDSGDWTIIGGQSYDGGTYIVAFACTAP